MKQKFSIFIFLQLVIQVILLLGEHKVLTQSCGAGFVAYNGACDECGVTYYSPNVRVAGNQTLIEKLGLDGKIVGGVVANANSWPAQALLYIKTSGGTSMCGGTLIKRNVVLTAAHCTTTLIGSNYQIYLGAHDRTKLTATGVFRTTVSRVIVHSGYSSRTMQNDIAILILSQPAPLSARIQIACLPSLSSTFPSSNIDSWIVGWGTTSSQGSTSPLLRNAKIQVLNPTTACSRYSPTYWTLQVCAGLTTGGKDTCQGDSGGPLYVSGTIGGKTKYIHAGITSYGIGCALKDYPGIYTRTAAYISWITANSV